MNSPRLSRGKAIHSPASAYRSFREQRYFAALDGVRAISILLVVIAHSDRNSPSENVWTWLSGFLGVPIFFVLSGFLITTLALREEDERASLSLAGFYRRRFFRIVPLYCVVLGIYCFLSFGVHINRGTDMAAALPYFLTYMNELSPSTIFYHSWSLGIEEKFYLIWPLLAFHLWRGRATARLIGTVCLAALPIVIGTAGGWFTNHRTALWLPSYSMIMIGCLLAECLHDPAIFERLRALASKRCAITFLTTTLALHLCMPLFPERASSGYVFVEVAYTAGVALCLIPILIGQPRWAGFLQSRPMQYLGTRSYAIYLIHNLAVQVTLRVVPDFADHRVRALMWLAGTLVLSIIAAEVLHRLIEKPCIRLGRRLNERGVSADKCLHPLRRSVVPPVKSLATKLLATHEANASPQKHESRDGVGCIGDGTGATLDAFGLSEEAFMSNLQSSDQNDPEQMDRKIESWTDQRSNQTRDELARKSIDPQARNQGWWEALPMTYEDWDSEERIPVTSEDFARVDAFYFRTNPYLCTNVDFDSFAGKKVLEIGCGAGSAACRFAQGEAEVTAVDLTGRATALTKAHAECLKVAVDVRQIDAETLQGIPDESFDFVYSWGVLHHSQAPDRAYQQIARVLKPGEQYLVMVYHKASLRYVVRGLAHLLFKGKLFAGDNLETVQRHYTDGFYHRHYTKAELRRALEQAGLSVQKMDVTHMSSRMMPGLPASLRAMLKRQWGWLLVVRGTRSASTRNSSATGR